MDYCFALPRGAKKMSCAKFRAESHSQGYMLGRLVMLGECLALHKGIIAEGNLKNWQYSFTQHTLYLGSRISFAQRNECNCWNGVRRRISSAEI